MPTALRWVLVRDERVGVDVDRAAAHPAGPVDPNLRPLGTQRSTILIPEPLLDLWRMPFAVTAMGHGLFMPLTMGLMFCATLLLMPLIGLHRSGACRVMRGKVARAHNRVNGNAVC